MAVFLAVAVLAGNAAADSSSTNWSGYAVTAPGASFTDVSGRWVAPAVSCLGSHPTHAAFWVGLGGFARDSTGLEQTGTQADCYAGGRPRYTAWYELLPARPVSAPVPITPGDTIAAQVSVAGASVTFRLDNVTTGNGFATQIDAAAVDVASAEWIAEAPSDCSPYNQGRCSIEPLANFGTIAFSSASATANNHRGPISDPAWTTEAIELTTGSGAHAANASGLSSDGSAFTVSWQSTGGPLELAPLGFKTTRASGGRILTVTMVVAATDPSALTETTTSCSATIDERPARPLERSFANPTARCRWAIPTSARGKTIRGSITASARGAKIVRTFSSRIQ